MPLPPASNFQFRLQSLDLQPEPEKWRDARGLLDQEHKRSNSFSLSLSLPLWTDWDLVLIWKVNLEIAFEGLLREKGRTLLVKRIHHVNIHSSVIRLAIPAWAQYSNEKSNGCLLLCSLSRSPRSGFCHGRQCPRLCFTWPFHLPFSGSTLVRKANKDQKVDWENWKWGALRLHTICAPLGSWLSWTNYHLPLDRFSKCPTYPRTLLRTRNESERGQDSAKVSWTFPLNFLQGRRRLQ